MAAKTAIKEPKRSSALVRRETFASYCFLLPSLIFFLGFVIYPMVLCVVTSFFDSTMNRADIFVGLANYKELFTDPIFLGALKNTFIIVVVSVPVTCAFSLWVSSAIVDLPEWATSLFRCVFYLPVVTGSVAVTVVWKWMYNNYYGIFNYLGKTLGLIDKNINWLGDERFALGCIILILLTTSVGQPIVLYVSALGNVDQSIVEAAEVDGATDFQCFWKIKWPAIMPTTLYILVITTINSFQCFALIQLLTSGGPNHSTDTIMYYIYYKTRRDGYTGKHRRNGAPSHGPHPPASQRPECSPPQGSWGCTDGRRSPGNALRCSPGGTAGRYHRPCGMPSCPQRSPERSGTRQ